MMQRFVPEKYFGNIALHHAGNETAPTDATNVDEGLTFNPHRQG